MKVITDYARQPRPYADHIGECVIELEEGETIQDVIKKYVAPKRDWFERTYSRPIEISSYKTKQWDAEKGTMVDVEYKGRLVKMIVRQPYLD